MTPSTTPTTTWFGIIFAPGRRLLTAAVGILVIAVTVLSAMFPLASSWLILGGGTIAVLWYTRMMTLYRNANKHTHQ